MIRLVSKRFFDGRCAWTLADRVEAGGDRVLGRGQRDQPAVGVAQRRSGRGPAPIATSRSSAGLLPRHALEEVDLLVGRRQPGQVELAQPLQLQALRRCAGAGRGSAGPRPSRRRRAEREVVVHHRAAAAGDVVVTRRTPAGSGCAVEDLAQRGRHRVGVLRLVRPGRGRRRRRRRPRRRPARRASRSAPASASKSSPRR